MPTVNMLAPYRCKLTDHNLLGVGEHEVSEAAAAFLISIGVAAAVEEVEEVEEEKPQARTVRRSSKTSK